MSRAAILLSLACLLAAPMLRASAAAEALAESLSEIAGPGSAEATPEPEYNTAQLFASTVERVDAPEVGFSPPLSEPGSMGLTIAPALPRRDSQTRASIPHGRLFRHVAPGWSPVLRR